MIHYLDYQVQTSNIIPFNKNQLHDLSFAPEQLWINRRHVQQMPMHNVCSKWF